jgi:hypothetical protein
VRDLCQHACQNALCLHDFNILCTRHLPQVVPICSGPREFLHARQPNVVLVRPISERYRRLHGAPVHIWQASCRSAGVLVQSVFFTCWTLLASHEFCRLPPHTVSNKCATNPLVQCCMSLHTQRCPIASATLGRSRHAQ